MNDFVIPPSLSPYVDWFDALRDAPPVDVPPALDVDDSDNFGETVALCDDADAYDAEAILAVLTPLYPDVFPPLLRAVAGVIATFATTHAGNTWLHYTDSTVDEVTREVDFARFAVVTRDFALRRLADANISRAMPVRSVSYPNGVEGVPVHTEKPSELSPLEPVYCYPIDAFACMTFLLDWNIASVAHDQRRGSAYYDDLLIQPYELHSDIEVQQAFVELLPYVTGSDFAPSELSPVDRLGYPPNF